MGASRARKTTQATPAADQPAPVEEKEPAVLTTDDADSTATDPAKGPGTVEVLPGGTPADSRDSDVERVEVAVPVADPVKAGPDGAAPSYGGGAPVVDERAFPVDNRPGAPVETATPPEPEVTTPSTVEIPAADPAQTRRTGLSTANAGATVPSAATVSVPVDDASSAAAAVLTSAPVVAPAPVDPALVDQAAAAIALAIADGEDIDEEVEVVVRVHVGGLRNGVPWPEVGQPLTLPYAEALDYLRQGYVALPTDQA